MSHIRFPANVEHTRVLVVAEDRECEHCGGFLYVRGTKHRYLWSSDGATHLVVQLLHCPDRSCAGHKVTVGAEAELAVAMPYWSVTWDVFAWMGHRRFSRHWSVPQIRAELQDRFRIEASSDWVEDYLRCYQAMVAARESDVEGWATDYHEAQDVILTIDGLQPEKGHETLYVVRELRAKRVWFAQPLLSSSTQEVQQLFERAARMAKQLGKPVRCWMSDKQDAFVKGIAKVFPRVPHRYCANHFLRDLAKPMLEADSHAKVQMRRKVRGLREIEKRQLQEAAAESDSEAHSQCDSRGDNGTQVGSAGAQASPTQAERRQVVFDYCGAVRGILNDDQGGPLHPPGLRMSQALEQVQESLQRSIVGDGSSSDRALQDLSNCIERGTAMVSEELQGIAAYAAEVQRVQDLLNAEAGTAKSRKAKFHRLATKNVAAPDPILQHMGRTMKSFAKGLFAGGEDDYFTDCSGLGRRDLSLMAFHSGLYGAFAPFHRERFQKMLEVLPTLDADALCLSHVMADDDKSAMKSALEAGGYEVYFAEQNLEPPVDDPTDINGDRPPLPETPPCTGPETLERMGKFLDCLRRQANESGIILNGKAASTYCSPAAAG